jgi:hypothetical protein
MLQVMKNESSLTAREAVLRGHLVVALPMLVIIGLTTTIVYFLIGPFAGYGGGFARLFLHAERLPIGSFAGVIAGWLWWSVSVPRWREWAKIHGADEEQTQKLAVKTLLVWPRGSIFEKTEFRTRKNDQ